MSLLVRFTLIVLLSVSGVISAAGCGPGRTSAQSDRELNVAVAGNFTLAMKELAAIYEDRTGHDLILVFGSTGQLFAQIKNGASFDAFFAADVRRAQLLDEDGAIVDRSRFTYAIGRPVLWSTDDDLVDDDGQVLTTDRFRRIAMADPKLAPYGEAARQVMIGLGAWDDLQSKLIFSQNVNQAHQFIDSGNADLGFIALSQVIEPDTGEIEGSHWLPPPSMYDPVDQQAVILKRTEQLELVQDFMAFVRGDRAAEVIEAFGYDVGDRDAESATQD